MGKRLKKLIQTFPGPKEKDEVASEVSKGHPRGAALVAAAFLDIYLEFLIKLSLVPLRDEETMGLFGPDRPLGTFSSRIKIAQALGIFGRKTAHDLNIMREIRNAFAHGIRKMNFNTPEVKELLMSLHCLADIENYRSLSSRKLFLEVTAMLLTHIAVKREKATRPRPLTEPFCPHLD